MTHTLHRQGNEQNLKHDYVLLAKAANGVNEVGAADKLRQFLRIALHHKAVNMGHGRVGNMYTVGAEEVITKVTDNCTVTVVFDDLDRVVRFVQEIKDANLGMSVVISSLFHASRECCAKVGLAPHSIEHSLGIWGKKEKLAPQKELELTTMCGHGLISASLVDSLVENLKSGRTTADAASRELARQCQCGIFNPTRGAKLLKAMANLTEES